MCWAAFYSPQLGPHEVGARPLGRFGIYGWDQKMDETIHPFGKIVIVALDIFTNNG
jgi:hypothetical protein